MVKALRLIVLMLALAPSPAKGQNVVSLQANDGMFYTDITLNHTVRIRALIDTGAYRLHFCEDTAHALGLVLGERVPLITFAGAIVTRRTAIRSLRLGSIEVREVEALVTAKANCDHAHVLIGMGVLRRMHAVMVSGDTMTLVGPPPMHEANSRPSASPRRQRD